MPRSYVAEARKHVGPKRARIRPIIERLAIEHQDAAIALAFRSPLELLVSVMLSAQTTDVNVNRVTATLFEKYHAPEDYLAVAPEELERDIYATGFFRQKARSLRGTMRMLIEEFDGEVPATLEELVRLPGVARKTANVVAAELGRAQGVVVDTHVRRLSQRLGLTKQEDPVKIERDLMKLVPREDWARFPHLLIWHGRRVCDARRPRCEDCVVDDLCPSSRVSRGFGLAADAYERGRPDYPADALAFLVERLDLRPGRTVADLAAGTGKLTRLLAPTGADVIAVEPIAEMRAKIEGARVLDGAAEAIPLADASVDAVTVAQAFHWFRAGEALVEIHRVLRPGGGLALVWNVRDERDPIHAAVSEILAPLERDTPRRHRK
ncbi:MAG: endonuclease III, partial [Actinobacteria bacterium]